MELIRGIDNLRERHRGLVLTIGNFDGVHLGHQMVLTKTIEKAKALALPCCVMLFEPQPREYFAKLKKTPAPTRLSNFAEKYRLLSKLGIDKLLVVKFDAAFANMTAEDFVQGFLTQKLGVKSLIIGDDFRFGANKTGNFDYLTEHASFEVFNSKSFQIALNETIRISSTAIREALAAGELQNAKTMLGRDFSITGKVAHGDKLGRTLNYPTANIALKRLHSPLMGVFVVKIKGIGNAPKYGVANIGVRPTLSGSKIKLEVHVFDFNQDIYGKPLKVQFLHKLRDEQKFDSLSALKQQIEYDADKAKKWLENN